LLLEHYDDSYRTFRSKKPISKGSILLEIPDRLLITGNKVSKWLEKNNKVDSKEISVIPGCILVSMFLFFQSKQVDSFWKPYLDVIPASYDMLFLFHNELL
jgi:histone-lysine N-methyltransferase SETD3